MRFTRFELVVLLVGAAAVLAGMVLSLATGTFDYTELVAQALLFCVLFAAVRLGRRGGSAAAIIATVGYAALVITATHWTTEAPGQVMVLVFRLLSFGLVGIVGGELFTRLRYGLTRFGTSTALDDWSRVFNQEYLHRTLTRARELHDRYHEAASVVLVAISPAVFADVRPTRQRALVRAVAGSIRADVRTVDEVARLVDGRFAVLMPYTDAQGGEVVRGRLHTTVTRSLECRPEAITTRLLSLPAQADEFDDLIVSLAPGRLAGQPASGAYSSSGDMTLNPAAVSAASAPSASTLNTSTAASPEGSTKQ